MRNFKYLLFAGIAVSTLSINAQNGQVADGSFGYYRDALLFGQTSSTYGNTARMQGIGGAQTSLGADMSAAGANPAGLGMYNRSVFSFTPSVNTHNADAEYLGGEISTYRNNFNFANMGVVFNNNKGDFTSEKFKGGSFAITLGRVNDFNSEVTYQGRNTNSSIIDAFIQDAGNLPSQNLNDYSFSAFETYLINPVYEDEALIGYDSQVLGFPDQSETITTSGSQYDLNMAWGGNYDDKIYFGGGIGFSMLNYSRERHYQEQRFLYTDDGGAQQQYDLINSLGTTDRLDIDGSGINANFGLIVRPISFMTIGVSYKTATYYSLNEEGSFSSNANWNGAEINDGGNSIILNQEGFESDIFISQYNLRTPGRLNLGSTVFLGKSGFISGDVEFVDYSTGQLKSNDFSPIADNQTINNLYSNTFNYRLGAEFRYEDFRFRGGYAFFGDPYRNNSAFNGSSQNVSFGAGYRSRDFFLDLAVVNRRSFDAVAPYSLMDDTGSNIGPVANITNRTTVVSATLGFNF